MMKKLKKLFKDYFLTGLIVVIPGYISFLIIVALVRKMDGIINLLPPKYHPDTYLPFHVPGLGFIFTIILIFLVGVLFTNIVGKKFLKFLEDKLVTKIPFVRTIYKSSKNIIETVFSDKSQSFKEVVLVEYPRKGCFALAFITSYLENSSELKRSINSREKILSIFLPTTPNPTSGFLLYLPESEVIKLKMDVETAFKIIISGGIIKDEEKIYK